MSLKLRGWSAWLSLLLLGVALVAVSLPMIGDAGAHESPSLNFGVATQPKTGSPPESALPGAPVAVLPVTSSPLQAAQPTDRNDCDAVRGTEYRSDTERSWFLSNCLRR